MAVPYVHSPLSETRSIRIIQLLPAKSSTWPIACGLEEASLDAKPEYTALSYAWDGQQLDCPIVCSGRRLLVTRNCQAALRQLRHSTDFLHLWIDSICIDQTSGDERSQQVALMGEIYKSAHQVIVWLGLLDERTERAMQCIEELGTKKEHESDDEIQQGLHQRVERLKQGQ